MGRIAVKSVDNINIPFWLNCNPAHICSGRTQKSKLRWIHISLHQLTLFFILNWQSSNGTIYFSSLNSHSASFASPFTYFLHPNTSYILYISIFLSDTCSSLKLLLLLFASSVPHWRMEVQLGVLLCSILSREAREKVEISRNQHYCLKTSEVLFSGNGLIKICAGLDAYASVNQHFKWIAMNGSILNVHVQSRYRLRKPGLCITYTRCQGTNMADVIRKAVIAV